MKETRIHKDSVELDGAVLHILLPETNRDGNTYHDIDWGEWVAAEASMSIHSHL